MEAQKKVDENVGIGKNIAKKTNGVFKLFLLSC